MKAIIIAGGKGERLRPLTKSVAKPMVKVAGKPILLHIIELLKVHRITDFIIALCYLPQTVVSYFGNGSKFGVGIKYIYEQESYPMGTSGAILQARNFLDNRFVVVYGDILRQLNITRMIRFHHVNKAVATIHAYKRYGRDPKSMIQIDAKGRVLKFIERPKVELGVNDYVWSNGSFYIFEPSVYDFIPKNRPSDFGKDILPKVVVIERVFAYRANEFFIDIGEAGKLREARNHFRSSG